jgi:hypothetical protein
MIFSLALSMSESLFAYTKTPAPTTEADITKDATESTLIIFCIMKN